MSANIIDLATKFANASEIETRIKIDYSTFDRIVKELTGHDYEFVCDVESSNYCTHEYTVNKRDMSEYDTKALERFLETGRGNYIIRGLLTHMCKIGVIPECKLSIRVSW